MSEIQNLDLKIQFLNEHLRNGGIEQTYDQDYLREVIAIQFDENGKAISETVGPIVRNIMMMIFHDHNQELHTSNDFIAEYRSLLQKSYSFDQITIKTESEFDEFYQQYFVSTSMLFRGQREASWRLMSKLQREWIINSLGKTEEEYLIFIQKMISIGRANHANEIKSILKRFNIDSTNDIAVLGYLQHHSCPTPLLDWTYSLDNALYFAIDEFQNNSKIKEILDYFSIYYLEEENFTKGGYRELLADSIDTIGEDLKNKVIEYIAKDGNKAAEMREHFKGRKLLDKRKYDGSGMVTYMTSMENLINFPITFFNDKDTSTGIVFSLSNSKNILSQKGAFTWNASFFKPLDIVAKELYLSADPTNDAANFRFCKCANIHKDLEPYIRKLLNNKSITRDNVYTSIDINTWPIYEMCLSK